MKATLNLLADVELFPLEEADEAQRRSRRAGGAVYSWRTTGRSNWLERGISCVDVLSLTVLPRSLPDYIDMPDDEPEDE